MALEVAAYDVAYVLEELVRRVEANVLSLCLLNFLGSSRTLGAVSRLAYM